MAPRRETRASLGCIQIPIRELNNEQLTLNTPAGAMHLLVSSRNIPEKFEQPAMALILAQDITEIKSVENSLHEAVTNLKIEREQRERFVSTLTHDLRTPLMAVRMSSQLILKQQDGAQMHKLAERILSNVGRMDHMVHDLLDANRINAGEKLQLKLVKCEVHSLVEETLQALSEIHGDRFSLKGLGKCLAYVEPVALRRVIENLCGNAVKYGAAKTTITVAIEKTERSILLSVKNEGAPIPLAEQATLFNPFHRSAAALNGGKKGWGIGLSLVRGIAESHGGQVTLVSGEGQGTTFTVELPKPSAT